MMYGIFPDQGSNPCLLHWQWILYHKSAGKTLRNSYVSHLLGFKIITIVIKTPLPLTYKVYDVTYLSFPNYNPHPFIQNRISPVYTSVCLIPTGGGYLKPILRYKGKKIIFRNFQALCNLCLKGKLPWWVCRKSRNYMKQVPQKLLLWFNYTTRS